jgi:hypothetical protein
MSQQSWWRRAIAAVNREYDRRIRRASLVTEYGADHHGHAHTAADHAAPAGLVHPEADHDDDAAEIVNLPKGTPLGRKARPAPPQDADHPH